MAFVGIGLLLMTGFFFFGKIGEIGNVSRAGYVYEVTFYQARACMSEFQQTNDPGALEKVEAGIAKMIQLDVSLGHLKDSISQGKSVEEAVAAFTTAHGQVDTIDKSASLVKTLHGKPILDEIVRVTDKANAYSEQWRELLGRYTQEKDASKKRQLMERMASVQARYPEILVDFHAVLGKVSAGMNGFVKKLYLSISLLVGVVLAVTAFFIARSITAPLKRTVDFAQAMAKASQSWPTKSRNWPAKPPALRRISALR